MTLNMSMDNSSDDRWWESVDLSKLFLSSNCISVIPPTISNLPALQILDVRLFVFVVRLFVLMWDFFSWCETICLDVRLFVLMLDYLYLMWDYLSLLWDLLFVLVWDLCETCYLSWCETICPWCETCYLSLCETIYLYVRLFVFMWDYLYSMWNYLSLCETIYLYVRLFVFMWDYLCGCLWLVLWSDC